MEVLPLSPARQCATSYNFGMGAPLALGDFRADAGAIEQRGNDADLLGNVFAGAAAPGRAIGVQSLDLVADDCSFLRRSRAGGYAQPNLIRALVAVEGAAVQ